jgi:hypothetical protein
MHAPTLAGASKHKRTHTLIDRFAMEWRVSI